MIDAGQVEEEKSFYISTVNPNALDVRHSGEPGQILESADWTREACVPCGQQGSRIRPNGWHTNGIEPITAGTS